MKQIFLQVIIIAGSLLNFSYAQNVGIGTTAPDSSALLDISAANRGMLVPRVALTGVLDEITVPKPAATLLVYNTATVRGEDGVRPGFYTWSTLPRRWLPVLSAGQVDDGGRNIAIGIRSGASAFNGEYNIAVGQDVLRYNYSGETNTVVGHLSMQENTSGSNNTAVGVAAMPASNGSGNVAIGVNAMLNNTVGGSNTAIGVVSLADNRTGNGNIAIGPFSMSKNRTGNNNTAIGQNADLSFDNLSWTTAIGAGAQVGASNSMVLGGTGVAAVNVGIGVTIPKATLHVRGSGQFFSAASEHTGNFWSGTSNIDGIELTTSGNDAYAGIQRRTGVNLHLSKPADYTNGSLQAFYVAGSNVGSISTTGTSVAYNATSDYRLKEHVTASRYGLTTLQQIKVYDYNYRDDAGKTLYTGVMAQELYTLYPQAVQPGGADARENPWMVDYSKMTPLLIQSVQEQQAAIQSLQQKNDQLEQRLKKLELLLMAKEQ